MIARQFSHVSHWVFDLDHTLYPPEAQLFSRIEPRMIDWIVDTLGVSHAEADRLRQHYWATHGTTLAGLMREHDVDPGPYLTHVHDIDMSHMEKNPALAAAIANLPGRKIVYTNGSEPYARRVIDAVGLTGQFDAVYGIEHADFHPKPDPLAFETVFGMDGTKPDQAAMFEDDPRNLKAPFEMGLQTVHVADTAKPAPHIHHHTDDLAGFLSQLA